MTLQLALTLIGWSTALITLSAEQVRSQDRGSEGRIEGRRGQDRAGQGRAVEWRTGQAGAGEGGAMKKQPGQRKNLPWCTSLDRADPWGQWIQLNSMLSYVCSRACNTSCISDVTLTWAVISLIINNSINCSCVIMKLNRHLGIWCFSILRSKETFQPDSETWD